MSKVLVADDESNILMLLEIMIKDLDHEVIRAENGDIAIQKALEHKPDLIITDIVMPKKNGFEVCRTVRQTQEIANTPIILLSALGDEYNKITGFEEGADDYVTKPFNIEDLKTRAKLLLRRRSGPALLEKKPSILAPVETNLVETNLIEANNESEEGINEDCVSTGIAALDDHLYGGLPVGSNILVLGPLGHGKSSFARNFLGKGLENSDPCLCVAIDDDPKKIRQSLNSHLTKEVSHYEEEKKIRFVDAYSWSSLSPSSDEAFAVNGVLELNQLSGVISDASFEIGHTIQKKSGGRRVIDSISSLLVQFELTAVQRFLSQIARTSVAFGNVTTLFVMEDGAVSEEVRNNVKYIMDGVIELGQQNGQRVIRVASMKWSKYKSDWLPLN